MEDRVNEKWDVEVSSLQSYSGTWRCYGTIYLGEKVIPVCTPCDGCETENKAYLQMFAFMLQFLEYYSEVTDENKFARLKILVQKRLFKYIDKVIREK